MPWQTRETLCFLGRQTLLGPVRPSPTRLGHPAVRRAAATHPWNVRVLNSICKLLIASKPKRKVFPLANAAARLFEAKPTEKGILRFSAWNTKWIIVIWHELKLWGAKCASRFVGHRLRKSFYPGHALHKENAETISEKATGQQPRTKSARGPGDKLRIKSGWTGSQTQGVVFLYAFSRTCLAWKGFTKTKRRRSTGQQPRRKRASRPADKPRINWWWTAGQPWVNRGFCSSVGLNRISLVRAPGKMFRRCIFGALEGTGAACLLGEQFCWHPVLPDPAQPPRRAPRPDPPVVCPGFGLDKYIQFASFVPTKGRSEQLSTIPRKATRSVGFLATGPVGTLLCLALRRSAAPRWIAPTRTDLGMFGFWTRQVPIICFTGTFLGWALFAKAKTLCCNRLHPKMKIVSRPADKTRVVLNDHFGRSCKKTFCEVALIGHRKVAPPRPALNRLAPTLLALSCPSAPTSPARPFLLDWRPDFSRTCLAWKGFARTNKCRNTGQQQRTKTLAVLVINSGWIVCQPRVLFCICINKFVFLVFPKKKSGQLSSMPCRIRKTLFS